MQRGQPIPPPDQPLYNPMMQDALKDLNEFTYVSFLMQNKDFIEPNDEITIKKHLISIGRNITFGIILGTILNVQIKKVPKINFLHWNKYVRWTARIPIFFSPHLLMAPNYIEKFEDMFKIHKKYFTRIRLFQKTGDMRVLDPENTILQQFRDQMKNM